MKRPARDKLEREAIAELKALALSGDTESAHSEADAILLRILIALGFDEVVDAWRDIDKWYA